MDKIKTIIGEVEVHKIQVQVEVPVYEEVTKPDYVLVKEEIVYQVPKILYDEHTYEKPVLVEKEYVIPKYIEKVYEIPVYIEKEYEIPVTSYVDKIIEVPQVREIQKLVVTEVPKEIEVVTYKKVNKEVVNAVIKDKEVTNAVIRHVTVEAIHPKYVCSKCKKEEVNAG